eukprot:UN31737
MNAIQHTIPSTISRRTSSPSDAYINLNMNMNNSSNNQLLKHNYIPESSFLKQPDNINPILAVRETNKNIMTKKNTRTSSSPPEKKVSYDTLDHEFDKIHRKTGYSASDFPPQISLNCTKKEKKSRKTRRRKRENIERCGGGIRRYAPDYTDVATKFCIKNT